METGKETETGTKTETETGTKTEIETEIETETETVERLFMYCDAFNRDMTLNRELET